MLKQCKSLYGCTSRVFRAFVWTTSGRTCLLCISKCVKANETTKALLNDELFLFIQVVEYLTVIILKRHSTVLRALNHWKAQQSYSRHNPQHWPLKMGSNEGNLSRLQDLVKCQQHCDVNDLNTSGSAYTFGLIGIPPLLAEWVWIWFPELLSSDLNYLASPAVVLVGHISTICKRKWKHKRQLKGIHMNQYFFFIHQFSCAYSIWALKTIKAQFDKEQ